MSVYDLKPKFQNLLRPITQSLASKGVTANQVTISALVISVVTGVLTTAYSVSDPSFLLLVPVTLFVRMALNAIDGMLAREHEMKSKLGTILNEVCDVLSDTALYLCFINFASTMIVAVLLFLSVLTEYIGVIGVMTGNGRRYEGPMGKSDRAVAFGGLALLLVLEPVSEGPVNCILLIIAILLVKTCINRTKAAIA